MITLEIENLRVQYDHNVALNIDRLSLSSTIMAVLGHNGAGKSTLLKTLLGLLAPQRGTIGARSQDQELLVPENDMAFCPENGAIFEDIPVSDYLRVWLRLRGKDDSLTSNNVPLLLDLFEVEPLLKKLGRELSKGQRRRVQSVVGFLIEPKLFLFDEPFDGLDVQRTSELASILENRKDTTAFMISSHRMDVIERVADAGIVLAEGALVAQGTIEELPTQLGGKSFLLDGQQLHDREILKEIERRFPVHVAHIGERVVITGSHLYTDTLRSFLSERGVDISSIQEVSPTLTDAMSYHLRHLRISKSS